MVVVKLDGPQMCKTDEVGEICICSNGIGSSYWGLPGVSNITFKVHPLLKDDEPLGQDMVFTRSIGKANVDAGWN